MNEPVKERMGTRYERFILKSWVNLLALMVLVSIAFNLTVIFFWRGGKPLDQEKLVIRSANLGIRVNHPDLRNEAITIPGRPHPLPFLMDDASYRRALTRRVTFTCSTDSRGFRGAQQSRGKGLSLVACVGASITFGLGVADGEAYPAVLQRLLREKGEGAFDVVNAGVPGQTTPEIAILLEKVVLPMKPDVVVINHEYNNLSEFGPHFDPHRFRLVLDEPEYARLLASFRGDLRRMVDAARAAGARPVIVGSPYNTFFPFQDARRYLDAARETAQSCGVPFVDAASLLQREEEREGLTLVRDGDRQKVVAAVGGRRSVVFETVYPQRNDASSVSPDTYAFLDRAESPGLGIFIDGSHPRPRGHLLVAQRVFGAIETLESSGAGGRI